mmetsp:Transcript_13476/g.24392  ORF Transcript_13476/g.24392 Transcript_13476/m.24392 type:complete len:205 (-) Transcript_13476:176-790(-)
MYIITSCLVASWHNKCNRILPMDKPEHVANWIAILSPSKVLDHVSDHKFGTLACITTQASLIWESPAKITVERFGLNPLCAIIQHSHHLLEHRVRQSLFITDMDMYWEPGTKLRPPFLVHIALPNAGTKPTAWNAAREPLFNTRARFITAELISVLKFHFQVLLGRHHFVAWLEAIGVNPITKIFTASLLHSNIVCSWRLCRSI